MLIIGEKQSLILIILEPNSDRFSYELVSGILVNVGVLETSPEVLEIGAEVNVFGEIFLQVIPVQFLLELFNAVVRSTGNDKVFILELDGKVES
jgi:hypothetical protein